jgi:periplasmic copper chaperone A
MRRRRVMGALFLIGVGVVLGSVPRVAFPQSRPEIRIEKAWARRAPMGSPGQHGGDKSAANGAVYMTVTNRGATGDAIVAAASDAARAVELHEVKNDGGVMAMRPVARMDVPAGGQLQLKPGGYHVMLLGLTRDLNAGDMVKVTVTFEKAGPMTIAVPVQ